jgi:diaminobutyrate-2-oxoglutarate transaminase
MNQIIDQYESEVRGYCRSFTTTFDTAQGAWLTDVEGKRYLDFFAGAGALNYGHNHPALKEALLEHIQRDGVTHSLDMYSAAKQRFLEAFHDRILEPRGMDYRVQFPGPTGTNAVEAAIKLARKVTGRTNVVYFTHGYHGMTLGALAVTANGGKRASAGVPLTHTTAMPFDGFEGEGVDTVAYFRRMLEDRASGHDKPAAVILETVQGEGGVRVASADWLRRLAALCREHEILLIVDDIQVGCGRTGAFFSFEEAGIAPDLVTLSKSLSGYGLPFAAVLIRPEHDIWKPAEHNGTFRGNNLAFATGAAATAFWQHGAVTREVERKGPTVRQRFERLAAEHPVLQASVRGRGFIWGLDCGHVGAAEAIAAECYQRGLLIECAGVHDQVLKFLAPLTIESEDLAHGLDIVEESADVVARRAEREAA